MLRSVWGWISLFALAIGLFVMGRWAFQKVA